jgi:predicted phosphate transport protein (TIGR00153 family)
LSEKPIINWLGQRRESKVLKELVRHSDYVVRTANELNKAIISMSNQDYNGVQQAINRMSANEKSADTMEKSISEELIKGDLNSKEREELLRLANRIDVIADWIKDGGRNLTMIMDMELSVSSGVWNSLIEISGQLVEIVRAMDSSLKAVLNTEADIEALRDRVEEIEHTIDQMYYSVKKEIITHGGEVGTIFLLRDLLHCIENGADATKDASDVLHIFSIAHAEHS